MNAERLKTEVLEVMQRHSLPPTFKGHYTHADVVTRLWYLAARVHNEECDDRQAAARQRRAL